MNKRLSRQAVYWYFDPFRAGTARPLPRARNTGLRPSSLAPKTRSGLPMQPSRDYARRQAIPQTSPRSNNADDLRAPQPGVVIERNGRNRPKLSPAFHRRRRKRMFEPRHTNNGEYHFGIVRTLSGPAVSGRSAIRGQSASNARGHAADAAVPALSEVSESIPVDRIV